MICDHYFGLLLSMLVLRHNATCRNNGISWVDASWLVVDLPLWRMMEFVSWDDEIPNIWKHKTHVPNHQPDINSMHTLWILYTKSNRALFCNLLKKLHHECRSSSERESHQFPWPKIAHQPMRRRNNLKPSYRGTLRIGGPSMWSNFFNRPKIKYSIHLWLFFLKYDVFADSWNNSLRLAVARAQSYNQVQDACSAVRMAFGLGLDGSVLRCAIKESPNVAGQCSANFNRISNSTSVQDSSSGACIRRTYSNHLGKWHCFWNWK